MSSPPDDARLATFPALDAEPPHPSLKERARRLLMGAGVLVVLAALAAGGWAISRAVSGGASAPPGELLAWQTSATLALVRADGSKPVGVNSLGFIGGSSAVAAPDGRALVTDAGDVVTLDRGRPAQHSTGLYGPLSAAGDGSGVIASSDPFADGDADVLFSGAFDPTSGASDIRIASIDGTNVRDLGNGTGYAGDPQQAAAYVTVTAATSTQNAGAPTDAGAAIEHRVAGGATSTLITAAQVAKDLSLAGRPPLTLTATPDATGNYLAVEADGDGTVVLDRGGRVIGHTSGATNGGLFWSPSGRMLAFTTTNDIEIWTPGGGTARIALPSGVAALQSCVWSPDEQRIACAGFAGAGQPIDSWVLVDRSTSTARAYPAAALPLVWTSK